MLLATIAYIFFSRQAAGAAQALETGTAGQAPSLPTEPSLEPGSTTTERSYEIVTLLPKDAIPAIDNPRFYSAAEADAEYDPDELVLGVTINGESKAYSTSHLDSHEIVNDTLGGKAIAVTW